jgi:hypothetical protein
MSTIPISVTTFESLNIITVHAGTNCPAGGDSGHGGRTIFGITNNASSDLRVGVNGEPPTEVNAVEIVLGGDTECETFIQALEHALNVLKAHGNYHLDIVGTMCCNVSIQGDSHGRRSFQSNLYR